MTDKTESKEVDKKNRVYVRFEVDVKKALEKFGPVSDAVVIGHGRGSYAFVTFETEEAAALAIKDMNGKSLQTNGITVELSTSKPRKRRTRNAAGGRRPLPKKEGDGKEAAVAPVVEKAAPKTPAKNEEASTKKESGKKASGKKESAKKA